MTHFGRFGGYGTWGSQIKILRPLFNTNTPLKPSFSHFGNHFRPRKSDFWPFYWFWSFSHWNSHWSRKILRTAEGRVVHQKQKLFWKSETKWNNLKPCRSWRNKIFSIRIILPVYPLSCQAIFFHWRWLENRTGARQRHQKLTSLYWAVYLLLRTRLRSCQKSTI